MLSRYKDTARGAWSLETVSLEQRAFAVGNAVAHGLDADASDAVGAAIARVTGADVQRVAKKYFQRFDVALVMPRASGNSYAGRSCHRNERSSSSSQRARRQVSATHNGSEIVWERASTSSMPVASADGFDASMKYARSANS